MFCRGGKISSISSVRPSTSRLVSGPQLFRRPDQGLRKVETFVQLTGLPGRPVHQTVFAGCTQRLCDRRLWLMTKSALEVCIHDNALYKLTTFFNFLSFLVFFLSRAWPSYMTCTFEAYRLTLSTSVWTDVYDSSCCIGRTF